MLGEARPGSLGAVGVTLGSGGAGRQAAGSMAPGLGDRDVCVQGRGQGVEYLSFRHYGV